MGPATRRAIDGFQTATGYVPTGTLKAEQAALLQLHADDRGTAASWTGTWGSPSCDPNDTIVTLSETDIDLSTFEMQCQLESVNNEGNLYSFGLSCSGEAVPFRASLSAIVGEKTLELVRHKQGMEFTQTLFRRC